jgi:UDP-3-O-[3-hydroxymyristoyl] glucosamine N-acyltransferase
MRIFLRNLKTHGWEYYSGTRTELKKEFKKRDISIGSGVIIGNSVYIGNDVKIGENVSIDFGVKIGNNVSIGSCAEISFCATINDNVTIDQHLHIEDFKTIPTGKKMININFIPLLKSKKMILCVVH